MTKWVLNKRTKTAHAVEDGHTLCNWWAGDMQPIGGPLDASRVCTDCAAKLRKQNAKLPWATPVVFRHDRRSFVKRIKPRVRVATIQSMALEAAQKGYWGIL